jgi:hypothetical protein
MKPFPEGLVGTMESARLRIGVDNLLKEVASGPIGIQRWGKSASLVLMSMEDFEAMWRELQELRGA